MNRVFFALGSNLGDRLENLANAARLISKHIEITDIVCSSIYESTPLLPVEAKPEWNLNFLNMVTSGNITTENPIDLLKKLKNIEHEMGRDLEAPRWSPRIIDIDILVFDKIIFKDDNLEIPHSQLCYRPFVLKPLLELYEKLGIFGSASISKICNFEDLS